MRIKTANGSAAYNLYELEAADRCTIRRWYKALRIAIYAPQSYTGPDRESYQGCYGMERQEAKGLLAYVAQQVDWAFYLGSK